MQTPNTSGPKPPTPEEIAEGFREFQLAQTEEIDHWHFAMMNDTARNVGYETALKNALANGPKVVLDIGTGSGLLSMLAIRHGASRVVTCEAVSKIARKAVQIIKKNGFEGKIQVINKKSTDLIEGKDFQERADILVTEIFDDGLLGEYALTSIAHAKKHLLKPGAQIIPSGAKLFAILLESKEILENARVGQVAGFDLSLFNEFECDNYVGYHLDKMKYKPLSAPKVVCDFNFYDEPHARNLSFDVDVIAGGTGHAVAYWYELRTDETTTISTAPGLPTLSGWKQAVQLLDQPKNHKAGEKIKLTVEQELDSLWFTI